MPRTNRLDFPGAFQHVIARGIEKRYIFKTHEDKADFLARLKSNLETSDIKLYAWSIMGNHFHLLVQTNQTPLSKFMRKLLTGYAVSYNLRHKRVGHLFQNRYKSVVCDKEEYFLRLIRYIHLNPVRAKFLEIEKLKTYSSTGHKEIVELSENALIEIDDVLSHFDSNKKSAVKSYIQFVYQGVGKDKNLSGGGLRRSIGKELKDISKKDIQTFDDRILGGGDFVEKVLQQTVSDKQLNDNQISTLELIQKIEGCFNLEADDLKIRNKSTQIARDVFIYLGHSMLGESFAELGRHIGIKRGGASLAFERGKHICKDCDIKEKVLNSY